MKKWIMIVLLCLSTQAFALELAGVHLDDRASVGQADLLLNGAGVRSKLIFKVYVIGLYLDYKTDQADIILKNAGPKRLTLVMLRDVDSREMVDAFREGIARNTTSGRLQALETSIRDFSTIFEVIKQVKEGDVILIDYVQGFGTTISLNGVPKGHVGGGLQFYTALLSVWIGEDPVDSELRDDLLGKKAITLGVNPIPNAAKDKPQYHSPDCCN